MMPGWTTPGLGGVRLTLLGVPLQPLVFLEAPDGQGLLMVLHAFAFLWSRERAGGQDIRERIFGEISAEFSDF